MSKVKEIAGLMKALEDQLVVCMRCGMCQAVCPLYAETGRETDVARGKLVLLDGLMQEMFDDPKGISDRLNKCLLCGSCAAGCPSGVSVLEIFIKARAILTALVGLSTTKKAILRGMLAHPAVFDHLAEWGARFQKLFTKPANDILGTSCARFISPLIGQRHFKPLAPVPFHRFVTDHHRQIRNPRMKVAFFIGCLIDKIFPQVAVAALAALQHHQVEVFIPANQACCGIPALSGGDSQAFYKLTQHNLRLFEIESYDYLLTCCATCTSTLKEIWPMMAKDRPEQFKDSVYRLAAKTLDINQFLVNHAGIEAQGSDHSTDTISVTYHDPCHLKKALGITIEPRTLIGANPNYNLYEMQESDWCCGLGGSFNLQYYSISSKIGSRKRSQIQATGCSQVATGCPACMLQLSDMLSKSESNVRVVHPVEIYTESLPGISN